MNILEFKNSEELAKWREENPETQICFIRKEEDRFIVYYNNGRVTG